MRGASFPLASPWQRREISSLLRRLPPLAGDGIRIETTPGLRDRRGPVHAGAELRRRRIRFDCTRAEFPRIFTHELFHFVWFRLGNPARRSFEDLLIREKRAGAPGELGWSAEWRKMALAPVDLARRTRRWREYCCESFCDTAAWLYAGLGTHEEFTLPRKFRRTRAAWFRGTIETKRLSI